MPVPHSDLVTALVAELVHVLNRADRPETTIPLDLTDDVAVVQLQAEGLAVAPAEDGEAVLEVGGLLLADDPGTSDDEAFARDAADHGLERRQEVADCLLRGPTGQDQRA
jgi:hypothetical protein